MLCDKINWITSLNLIISVFSLELQPFGIYGLFLPMDDVDVIYAVNVNMSASLNVQDVNNVMYLISSSGNILPPILILYQTTYINDYVNGSDKVLHSSRAKRAFSFQIDRRISVAQLSAE